MCVPLLSPEAYYKSTVRHLHCDKIELLRFKEPKRMYVITQCFNSMAHLYEEISISVFCTKKILTLMRQNGPKQSGASEC